MRQEPFARRGWVAAAFVSSLLLVIGLWAQGRRALMPGDLSLTHDGAAFQQRATAVSNTRDLCGACHASFQGVPDDRCVQCHPNQKTLIPAHRPAAMAQALAREGWRPLHPLQCIDCHTEHLGKRFRPAQVSDDRCTTCHPVRGMTADAVRMRKAHLAPDGKGTLTRCVACHVQHGDFSLPRRKVPRR